MSDLISRQAAIEAIVAARDKQAAKQAYGWEWEYNGFNYAIQALPMPSAEPEQRWIPCSERLPEKCKDVFVCYDFKSRKSISIAACYSDGSFHGYDDEYLTPDGRKYRKVIAWMPLPKPYQEEGGE